MTLLHKNRHVPQIRAHEKTVTRRDWKPNYSGPRIGSVQMVASADMVPDHYDHNSPMLLKEDDCTCFVQVMDKYRQPLGEMTDEDARREGDYETVDEFRRGWERIHGDGSWDPDQEVTVVGYVYVGRERPGISAVMGGCPNCRFADDEAVRAKQMQALVLGPDLAAEYADESVSKWGGIPEDEWVCDYHRTKYRKATHETVRELLEADDG